MPHVTSLISAKSSPTPETVMLFLPSLLPDNIRCLPELKEICQLEHRLREAQASDVLATVQRQRRVIQGLWQFKKLNASGAGNKPNTRMVNLYKRFDDKTKRAAEEYHTAWKALTVLDHDGPWRSYLKELQDGDIRGPAKDPDDLSSNSRYQPSWIWLVAPPLGAVPVTAQNTQAEFHDSMCVEWARSRAQMRRWKEEMRRVLEYLQWKAAWWRDQRDSRINDSSADLTSGLMGYATKQSTICLRIGYQCAVAWSRVLCNHGINPEWASTWMQGDAKNQGDDDENDEDNENEDDEALEGLEDIIID